MSRKSMRFMALGSLLGLLIGIITSLLFPEINLMIAQFSVGDNLPLRSASYKGGSVFNTFMIIPLITGILGALSGLIVFKISKLKVFQKSKD